MHICGGVQAVPEDVCGGCRAKGARASGDWLGGSAIALGAGIGVAVSCGVAGDAADNLVGGEDAKEALGIGGGQVAD